MTDQIAEPADDFPPAGLESRIGAHYDRLPESERKIADLILESPGEVAAYSATELATLAGASKAAVTRLIRRLGYENFEAARRAAREAQNWGSPLYLMSRTPARGRFSERIQAHIEQDVRNISLTLEGLRADVFADIVENICGAKRVYFLGYRNSRHLAAYARTQVMQARSYVHLMPAAGETIAEYMADMTREDLLIVIGAAETSSGSRPRHRQGGRRRYLRALHHRLGGGARRGRALDDPGRGAQQGPVRPLCLGDVTAAFHRGQRRRQDGREGPPASQPHREPAFRPARIRLTAFSPRPPAAWRRAPPAPNPRVSPAAGCDRRPRRSGTRRGR